ncbi:MAG: 16S rRNA (guanine(527)-N(7))-methyltransferase RsmG [Gemmatimonadaceae bacterium]|nr:16S rRNA (guanine(527)-N(7))-methyltransferase RsmG [Chitinophagaceae bacterium]
MELNTPGKGLDLILKYFADFTPEQVEQFARLKDLYEDWNSKINVISRKDIDSLYEKHVLHSLSIAAAFQFPSGGSVIDIGTGGGFPGIPLAIFYPEVSFHLVDSIGKKLKVVEGVAEGIGLKNVTVQHTRAEEIKNRRFDVVVSRAVAPLAELWRWGKPLIRKTPIALSQLYDDSDPGETPRPNGMICLKGGDLAEEISDSRLRPRQMEVFQLFPEEYFKQKYLLYVSI